MFSGLLHITLLSPMSLEPREAFQAIGLINRLYQKKIEIIIIADALRKDRKEREDNEITGLK